MRHTLAMAVTVAALLALDTHAASGQTPSGYLNRSCSDTGSMCTYQWGTPSHTGIAKIIKVPPPETEQDVLEQAAREAEWERVCVPVPVIGRDGISRMTYSRACPNGVIVGDGRRPSNLP